RAFHAGSYRHHVAQIDEVCERRAGERFEQFCTNVEALHWEVSGDWTSFSVARRPPTRVGGAGGKPADSAKVDAAAPAVQRQAERLDRTRRARLAKLDQQSATRALRHLLLERRAAVSNAASYEGYREPVLAYIQALTDDIARNAVLLIAGFEPDDTLER